MSHETAASDAIGALYELFKPFRTDGLNMEGSEVQLVLCQIHQTREIVVQQEKELAEARALLQGALERSGQGGRLQ